MARGSLRRWAPQSWRNRVSPYKSPDSCSLTPRGDPSTVTLNVFINAREANPFKPSSEEILSLRRRSA